VFDAFGFTKPPPDPRWFKQLSLRSDNDMMLGSDVFAASLFRHSFASTDSLAIGKSLRYVLHVSPRFGPKYNKYPAPKVPKHSKSDKLASNILELPQVRVIMVYHHVHHENCYKFVVKKKIYAWAPTEPTGGTPSWSSTLAACQSWDGMGAALFLELKLS